MNPFPRLPLLLLAPAVLADVAFARPNIVFIMSDDHSRESIGAYDGRYQDMVPTPGIDRIAAEGMRFDAMAATSSLCVPSRAALITGKYGHINGVRMNRDTFDGRQQTFPKLLQEAGYSTALFGKWHLSSQPTGFDYYAVLPGQGRFRNPPLLKTGMEWDHAHAEVTHGYLTDLLTDKAMDWIEAQPRDKPFCIMVHHKAPHVPHHPAPRHEHFLADTFLREPDNLLDTFEGRALAEMEDAIHFSRVLINREPQYRAWVEKWADRREEGTRAIYQEFFKGYLRLVKSLDENVVRLLDYLDESGLRENTIVIYTSDNGFFNGEHGLYNKMWMYEESMLVPLVVRWPGVVRPGSSTAELTSMLDFASTFLDMAGAPIPDDLQGVSFLPLLRGKEEPLRDALYYHYYPQFGVPEQFGVRTKARKLVHYPELEHIRWELFDLERDPKEMSNLAYDPEYAVELEQMKELLARKIAKYRDPVDVQDTEP